MTWAIGVDIGGTFTDCVAIDPEGGLHYAKAISTHHTDVSEGVLAALDELASLGEPVNRVLEVDLDGGEVTLTLYDLPPAAP